jgi:hypothetical protein
MAHTVIDQQRPAQPLTAEKVDSAGIRSVLVLVAVTVMSLVVCVVSFAASRLELAAGARPHSSAARLHTDSRTSEVIILATSLPIGPFSSPPPNSADS